MIAAASRLAGVLLAAAVVSAASADETAIRIELGRRLFYDADLSLNGAMSCATCHEQRHGFSDNNRAHPGALGHPGKRNVPGLANVGSFRNLTWADNSLGSLERQALNPLLGTHPIEMAVAGHEAEVIQRFAADSCYQRLFTAAFPQRGGAVDFDAITQALASFERTLVALDSPYDRAVRDAAPLADAAAEAGRQVFVEAGCSACHRPPYFTDDDFHRVQALQPGESDAGLSDVTGREGDRGRFRTPPLRNVAMTFPYWHDGRATTLESAIALHGAEATAAKPPGDNEMAALVAFLRSLSDENFIADPRFSLPPEACPLAR